MTHVPIDFTIVHGIPEAMRLPAAALYEDAFGPKFAVAIPCAEHRHALLSESLNLDYAFAAIKDDGLIGLAGYKTHEGSLTDGMTYSSLIKHAGVIRGNWAALVFSLYERSLTNGQLLMDGIVVDPSMRGQGVGTQLLHELMQFAGISGFESVRLDVVETNPNARRMYERNGFAVTRIERFGYLRWLLGFGASATLERATAVKVS
ncbi:Acetyltransferase (GNAT) family protein [Rubripirellula tenax]|uniref:Acetyltransferase (GNAT) family protein n=1 Tax=Rubripirellula tenax TaxID=2528015 RepID=A0A5C6E7K2_9BACT|nr:GNAT family N-acetyltransferase [Rubripirellula tenax]TWU44545.1 Acetyltransferase (GNAT) family protein [Rubripirellula tenax]